VGEAPGESENVIGRPFVGPAGHLLDEIIERSIGEARPDLTCAFTNLAACIPYGEDGAKISEPEPVSIRACQPRLKEFLDLAQPRLIVAVGKLAEDWLDSKRRKGVLEGSEIPLVAIRHPAAILRSPTAMRYLQVQKCIVTLQDAVEDL
jgi:uracil-DNA glycosylase family 4